ncbi:hypothetical protein niasHT_025826 [Heterodera trifolii]|uniref:Amino acid transporter n=1 Tax=Heterodera trifolii TaxID=157864 RepID=A0ABD2KF00_9BILA
MNKMGRWSATAFVINAIIGSGIFITPTGILNNVQSVGASLVVWLLSGLISVIGAFCYVELGTSIRKSGCDYAYLCHMRWPSPAFTFMCASNLFLVPCALRADGRRKRSKWTTNLVNESKNGGRTNERTAENNERMNGRIGQRRRDKKVMGNATNLGGGAMGAEYSRTAQTDGLLRRVGHGGGREIEISNSTGQISDRNDQ